jgi:hypothetical protein
MGYEIEAALRTDPHVSDLYLGTCAADTLPYYIQHTPTLICVNNKPLSHEGEHWLAISIDAEGHGEYFDSYGRPPIVKEHKAFLKRNCKSWIYNQACLQSLGSDACGQYCVTYLIHKAHNIKMNDFITTYFCKDTAANDDIVKIVFSRYTHQKKLCQDMSYNCNKQKCYPRKN